ncbi:ankyrin repeat-containing domain protein [Immersiella caudata]|uniref:Ankyrin repeat-containing domain protein n=1 Tax=Immersiella caudata TaxID=314043 RepID=A0AA39WLS6_9PEZI|nr:ankyrin repeat-containing domain protein [Immersiella caudata]
MHSSSCACKGLPVSSRKPTEDELDCSKISALAQARRRDTTTSNQVHPRHVGLLSLSRYFAPAPPTPKPSDIAALCQTCADLDIDAISHYLFALKIPINTANHVGTTPLLAAIAAKCAPLRPKSHLALVELLLESGADANMGVFRPGTQPTNPLSAAVALGLTEVVRLLIRLGANIDTSLPAPSTHGSSRRGHSSPGRNVGMAPLHVAVFADRADCLEVLLQHGAKSDITFVAAQSVCPVLPASTPPTSPSDIRRPKVHAIRAAKSGFVQQVTALHLAHNRKKCTDVLLRYGAAVGTRDGQGRTPLHWAVAAGNLDVVSAIVAAGADGDVSDDDGSTPLGMAMGMCGGDAIEMGRVILGGTGRCSDDDTGMRTVQKWV